MNKQYCLTLGALYKSSQIHSQSVFLANRTGEFLALSELRDSCTGHLTNVLLKMRSYSLDVFVTCQKESF